MPSIQIPISDAIAMIPPLMEQAAYTHAMHIAEQIDVSQLRNEPRTWRLMLKRVQLLYYVQRMREANAEFAAILRCMPLDPITHHDLLTRGDMTLSVFWQPGLS